MPGQTILIQLTTTAGFSGINPESKTYKKFLKSFINVKNQLTELHSTTASEMLKVLENPLEEQIYLLFKNGLNSQKKLN